MIKRLSTLTATCLLAPLCLLTASSASLAASDPIVRYVFGDTTPDGSIANSAGEGFAGKLLGGWQVVPAPEQPGTSVLALDGSKGYVEVPGSAGLHIGDEGFSIVATVRFLDSGAAEGQPDTHDMILFKDREYLLGRTRQSLYFNLHNGKEWAASVTGGECRPGAWSHAAVIVDRINEPPQGRVGYFIRLFLNGEMVAGREVLNCTVNAGEADVTLGKGWGGPWHLRGDLAQVAVYPRALTGGELNRLLSQEKLAPVKFRPVAAPDPQYEPLRARVAQAVAAVAAPRDRPLKQLLAAVSQAEHHVASQAALLPALATLERLAAGRQAEPVAAFVRAHPEFQFLDNGSITVAFFSPRPDAVVLCSLFDHARGQEVLGDQRELWELGYDAPSATGRLRLDSADPSLVSTVTLNRRAGTALLRWRCRPVAPQAFSGEVRSELRLTGTRLGLNLSVVNEDPKVALREVKFPQVRLRRLTDGTDQLLVPRMSGVLHPNPVGTYFRYEGAYPSGAAHMQFCAYYDDSRGVYMACEDGQARSKTLLAGAADEDCEFAAQWFVGCPGTGGNGFVSSGGAAIELFQGDWFDAAQIYKRFARTAAWWPASHSRTDTPAWLRDLNVWFIGNANTPAAEAMLIQQREMLDLPVGLHWYNWNQEAFDDDYPHFTPREGLAAAVGRMQAAGIYCKPYINGRVWETRDRGDEDVEYTSVALPATLKQPDGSPYLETYAKRFFAPMCPTTPVWQQELSDLCAQVASHGVSAIYLDQIAAARPRPCFDPTHPHAPGAGEAWLEQGYWPMMARIRRELRATNPKIALCSEDAAEPYMHLFDSFLPWRFLDIGHVPAYQAVYAGRVQLTARHFDDSSYAALFPKAAEQMLYGEQIGWFNAYTFKDNAAFAVFVKKLAHTRKAFLPFFNEGDMLKPGRFAEPPPTVTADWGFYGPRMITTPAVLHSAWRLDNRVAVLFANTTCDPVTVQFLPRAAEWGLTREPLRGLEYHEGQAPAPVKWRPGAAQPVTVPGYGLAALVFTAGPSSRGLTEQEAATAALFLALKRFDDETGMTAEFKSSERDRRNPWIVPQAPVRSASDWLAASSAPKLVRARAGEDGSFVGWIGDGGSLCFGPIDFGEAKGKPVVECEVGVPETSRNGRLGIYKVVDGKGVLWAETPLQPTGGYHTYTAMRLPLPAEVAGQHDIVIQISGSGAGICNVRRWRLVREP